MLELERRTYEEKLPELLKNDSGKFVLIKEAVVRDTFLSERDALRAGYRQFEAAPFFVQQILRVQEPLNFSNNNLFV